MIDIHSHILYGMDDGARTLEESVSMARMAAQYGTTAIVGTPHANLMYKFDPAAIAERKAEIEAACEGALKILTGSDFHLTYDNIQDAIEHPTKYCVGHKCYLLVEFSDLLIFKNMSEIFTRLQEAGMVPIITHPERNQLLQMRLPTIEEWVAAGVLLQVTGQSLLGEFGKRAREFSETLLAKDIVHFIASDAHDTQRRPPRLDLAYAHIEKKYGVARAERLFVQNPRACIDGVPLPVAEPETKPAKKFLGIFG